MRQSVATVDANGLLTIPGPGVALVLVSLSQTKNLYGESAYRVAQTDESPETWWLIAGQVTRRRFRSHLQLDRYNSGNLSTGSTYLYAVAEREEEIAGLSQIQFSDSNQVFPANVHADSPFYGTQTGPTEGTVIVTTGALTGPLTVKVRAILAAPDSPNACTWVLEHRAANGVTVLHAWERPVTPQSADIIIEGLSLANGEELVIRAHGTFTVGVRYVATLDVRQEN